MIAHSVSARHLVAARSQRASPAVAKVKPNPAVSARMKCVGCCKQVVIASLLIHCSLPWYKAVFAPAPDRSFSLVREKKAETDTTPPTSDAEIHANRRRDGAGDRFILLSQGSLCFLKIKGISKKTKKPSQKWKSFFGGKAIGTVVISCRPLLRIPRQSRHPHRWNRRRSGLLRVPGRQLHPELPEWPGKSPGWLPARPYSGWR